MRPAAAPRLLAVLSAGVLGAACAGDGSSSGSEASRPPRVGDTVPTTRTTPDGTEVPWLAAPTLDGDTVTAADLRGTPVLLNLWATWCPPCRAETPYLQSIHERYGPDLRTVGITVDNRGAEDQVRSFLEEYGVTYEMLHDPAMRSMDLFGLPGLPGTFVLDADGVVRFARMGPVLEGDLEFEGILEELVGAPGGTAPEGDEEGPEPGARDEADPEPGAGDEADGAAPSDGGEGDAAFDAGAGSS